jgi:hypothetical protein
VTTRRRATDLTIPQAVIWTLSTAAIGWAGNKIIDNYKATGEGQTQFAARDRELDSMDRRLSALEAKAGCPK